MTQNTSSTARQFMVILTVVLVGSAGCSSRNHKNSITGVVTLNDKPVSGTIEFISSDGKSESVPLSNGKYVTYGLTPGTFKIVVKGVSPMGSAQGHQMTKLPEMPGMEGVQACVDPPAKYADPNQSGLTFEFTGGQITHNIPLTP